MNTTRIVFSLDEKTVKILQEEFDSRKSLVSAYNSQDNPEASKVVASIETFLSELGQKKDIEFNVGDFNDEEDIEDFAEELTYLVDCFLEK